MNVMGRVFEKILCRMVTPNEMQFGFMSEKAALDTVFILRRLQNYHAKGKSCQGVL